MAQWFWVSSDPPWLATSHQRVHRVSFLFCFRVSPDALQPSEAAAQKGRRTNSLGSHLRPVGKRSLHQPDNSGQCFMCFSRGSGGIKSLLPLPSGSFSNAFSYWFPHPLLPSLASWESPDKIIVPNSLPQGVLNGDIKRVAFSDNIL